MVVACDALGSYLDVGGVGGHVARHDGVVSSVDEIPKFWHQLFCQGAFVVIKWHSCGAGILFKEVFEYE